MDFLLNVSTALKNLGQDRGETSTSKLITRMLYRQAGSDSVSSQDSPPASAPRSGPVPAPCHASGCHSDHAPGDESLLSSGSGHTHGHDCVSRCHSEPVTTPAPGDSSLLVSGSGSGTRCHSDPDNGEDGLHFSDCGPDLHTRVPGEGRARTRVISKSSINSSNATRCG